jgi:hypothetical protein
MKKIQFRIDEKAWEYLQKKYGGKTNQETMTIILRRLRTVEASLAISRSKLRKKSK